MAFNQQEQQLIEWGKQNGKSKEDVTNAITNYRLGVKTSPVQPVSKPGYLDRIKEDVGTDINNRVERYGEINARNDTNPIEKSIQKFGQGAGMAANALESTVVEIPGVKKVVGKIGEGIDSLSHMSIIKAIGDKIGGNKTIKEIVQAYDTDPNFRDTVDGVANSVRLGTDVDAGVKTGTKAIETGGKVINKVKDAISNISEDSKNSVNSLEGQASLESDLRSKALKDVTPEYNKKLISEPDVITDEGKLPRVKEGGIFSGRTVTPTKIEQQAADELVKIEGYDPQVSSLDKYNLVKNEITKKAEALKSSLREENILRPSREIKNVIKNSIDNTSEESLLLQKSDPVIKQYMRVVNNAISKTDGTLEGELKVRQLMDSAYTNARGKMAFGDGKISVLDEIHSSARNALNQDLESHAINTAVKDSLRSQSLLYRAQDALLQKAELEGGSSIERLLQKHPLLKSAVNATAKITGATKAINLIK